jgi:hypothetical protein
LFIKETKEEFKRFLEVNENDNTTYQNLWDTEKAVLRGKFIAVSVYIKRTERSQINKLMLHLKISKNQKQAKPKSCRRREIINIRAKINEIETKKKKIQRINKTKNWLFENINKIDNPLANLTKIRHEKIQINKIRNTKGEITKTPRKSRESSKTTLRTYVPNKFANLEEMDKFLDTYDHPKLNQEDISQLNRPIT